MTRAARWVTAVLVALLGVLVFAVSASAVDVDPSPTVTPRSGVRDAGPAPAPAPTPAATSPATRNPAAPLRDGGAAGAPTAASTENPLLKDGRPFPQPARPPGGGAPADGVAPTQVGVAPTPGATAAPGGGPGLLATVCRDAPAPDVPGRSALDMIDFGQASGDGIYATYRYAGWRSHLYNPGCADAAIGALAGKIGGTVGMVGEAVTEEGGSNKTTNIVLGGARLGVALSVAATRIGFGEYPVWDVLDQVTEAARVTFGRAVLAAFLSLGLIVSCLWLVTRRRLEWGAFGTALWRMVGITALGMVLIGWNGTVGAQYDDMTNETHRIATAAVTNDQSGLQAGDVLGEALMAKAYMPLWGAVHLGWDADAITTYAPRLHAASTFTVTEAQRVAGDQGAYDDLAEQKRKDYDTVADEIAKSHPASYRTLEGKDASGRVLFAALLALVVLSVAVVTGFAAFLVFAARVIVRVGAGIYPILVAALQFPALQKWGIGIPALVLRWAAVGVVATVASVAFHRVLVVAVLTDGTGSVFQRVTALTFVNVALIVGWLNREKLAGKAGMSVEYSQVAHALDGVSTRIESALSGPARKARAGVDGFRGAGRPDEAAKSQPEPDVDAAPAPTRQGVDEPVPEPKRAPRGRSAAAGPSKATRVAAAAAVKVAPPQTKPAVAAAARAATLVGARGRPARVGGGAVRGR